MTWRYKVRAEGCESDHAEAPFSFHLHPLNRSHAFSCQRPSPFHSATNSCQALEMIVVSSKLSTRLPAHTHAVRPATVLLAGTQGRQVTHLLPFSGHNEDTPARMWEPQDFCQAAFQTVGPQHILVPEVVPPQGQGFALLLAELHEVASG